LTVQRRVVVFYTRVLGRLEIEQFFLIY